MNISSLLRKQKLKVTVVSLIGLYIFSLLFFCLFRNQLVFQAKPLHRDYSFQFDQSFEEHAVTMKDGTVLNGLFFKSQLPSKGLVFYLHGNADNLQRWGEFAVDFTKIGYDVFMYDYRGYGKSNGSSSRKNIHADAIAMLDWTKKHIPYSKLIIYGRSLGSAVASNLAVTTNPSLLILETPFANFIDVIYWPLRPSVLLFPDKIEFSNQNALPKVKCPKVIFHGTNDWIVPLSSAHKLKPYLQDQNQFFIIEGAGHRNLSEFDSYHVQLAAVLHKFIENKEAM